MGQFVEDENISKKNKQYLTYNEKYEFFTKPLGPGHYNPKIEITKPKPQQKGNIWCKSKVNRSESPTLKTKSVPGPGEYNQYQNSIEIRQLENKLENEIKNDKEKT